MTASQLPYFGDVDFLIKKGAHAVGYAMLGVAYFFVLPSRLNVPYRIAMAFLMTGLFALSDEFHQSFVEGRTSSLRDVSIDMFGATVGLALAGFLTLAMSLIYSSNSRSKSIS